MNSSVVNMVVAGLGGQGVLKASGMVAGAAFRARKDVEKSEIHGMNQRGGSVSSDVSRARTGYPRAGDAGRAEHDRAQRRQGEKGHRPEDADMKISQLSVFSENKQGHLIAPCRVLARGGIDIRALSLADTQRSGILRMIIPEWEKAKALLEASGAVVKVTEVLAVEVPDRPGGLAEVLELFEGTDINIEYMYAFPFACGEKAVLIFRFDQPDAAIERLRAGGITVLDASRWQDGEEAK